MKKALLVLSVIALTISSKSQDQSPAGLKWKSIETENFELIFSSELADTANFLANMLEYTYPFVTKTLQVEPPLISLVIHNQSTISNGYAALFPRRMAWYTTPTQDVNLLGTTNWLQTLAVHEFRHIAQYAKNKQHFTKFASVFYGQMAQAGLRWSVPKWFFEGDAVCSETLLTNGGRGRIASFDMPWRAILLENKDFSYNQAVLGGYNFYFPDFYRLGYHLTAYARVNYGANIWPSVLNRTAKTSWYPFAFSRALKKHTGLKISDLYHEAANDFARDWKNINQNNELTKADTIKAGKANEYTNYQQPCFLSDSTIVALKTGLDYASAIVEINLKTGKETKIINTYTPALSAHNGVLVWEQYRSHSRFQEASFSEIMYYNASTKKTKRLTKRQKYFSPDIATNGTRIVAVEYLPKLQSNLILMYVSNGQIYDSLSIKGHNIIRPQWSDDGKKIVFTHSGTTGVSLSIYNTETKHVETIIEGTYEDISTPVFFDKYILYQSSNGGINNIFAIDAQSKAVFRVTSSKYGAFHPAVSPDGSLLVYEDYTTSGYALVQTKLEPDNWLPVQKMHDRSLHYYKNLVGQEQGHSIFDNAQIPQKKYTQKKYSHLRNAFNINYWGLFGSGNELVAKVSSNNKLNTLAAQANMAFDPLNNTRRYFANLSYAKWLPIININWQDKQIKQNYEINKVNYADEWFENSVGLSIDLPYNLAFGGWYSGTELSANINHIHLYGKQQNFRYLTETGYDALLSGGFDFFVYNYKYKAPKAVQTRLGQQLFIYHRSPLNNAYRANQTGIIAQTYWPGLWRSHSVRIGFAAEKQLFFEPEIDNYYLFASFVAMPRGHEQNSMQSVSKFTADYKLPLLYPNWGWGSLVYFKRIQANLFVDYAKGTFHTQTYKYHSYGAELTFDVNVFQIRQDIGVGVRASKIPEHAKPVFQLIIEGISF